MAKRKPSCWFVVSYYAGDRPGKDKPRGFVRGTMPKRLAEKHARFLQKEFGGNAANVVVKAFSCDRATKLFSLKV